MVSKSRWFLTLLMLLGGGYALYTLYSRTAAPAPDAASADTAKTHDAQNATKRSGPGRGTEVVAMAARKIDMPIYLRGLGTVIAYNTVTVRSRVDRQLVK